MSIAFESIDHIHEVNAMRYRTAILNICLALLIPLSAAAKPPKGPVPGGCELLLAPAVSPGIPFTVTVVRVPSYPGQWFAPEITVEISVPVNPDITPGPNSYNQSVTQRIDGLGGSNDATADFVIPSFTNLVFEDVNVFATVSEPVRKNKLSVLATCEAVTSL